MFGCGCERSVVQYMWNAGTVMGNERVFIKGRADGQLSSL